VVLFGLIVAFHLGNALCGRSLIRASHMGAALVYAQGPIDLLRPVIVGFNATGSPTALEFPVWQAAAGLAFKATGSTWYGWANIVSLLFFATALWPFFELARQYVGRRAAWWSLAFFLAQPVIVVMAGEAATDGFCLVVTLWFLFFADKMVRSGRLEWWLPAAFFAALSAVSKLPFFMAAGLCSLAMLIVNRVRDRSAWVGLAGAGIAAACVFGLWSRYTDSLAARAEFPFTELRLSHSPWLAQWLFGDLRSRLSPWPWFRGGWRFLHATLGSLPLAALLLAALARPGNRLPKLWLAGTLATTLVFTNLVLAHWHYYLMCCPAVAMLCGAALCRGEELLAREIPSHRLRCVLAAIVLVFSAVEGVNSMKLATDLDPFTEELSRIIREHTSPDDKLLVYNDHLIWGGEILFRSGRKGLVVSSLKGSRTTPSPKGLYDLIENEADLRRLKSLGYTRLVLTSESPAQFAVMADQPGTSRKRELYPATVSPKADACPTIFRSEDILIKELP
jgi:hypothetical protein